MMRRRLVLTALAGLLLIGQAAAQMCGGGNCVAPTPPPSDSSNRIATTAFANSRTLSVQANGDTNDSASGSGSFRAYSLTYTIPASFLVANRALRIIAHYRVTTGSAAPALELQLKVGGTVVAHYGPNTPSASVTNVQLTNQWVIQATAAPGASVPTEAAMMSNLNGIGSFTVESDTAQPVALNTAGTLAITIESKWATAGTGVNQLKLSQLIVEALN